MVIQIINNICITIFELKGNSPVAGNANGPNSLLLRFKFMQSGAREVHYLNGIGCI